MPARPQDYLPAHDRARQAPHGACVAQDKPHPALAEAPVPEGTWFVAPGRAQAPAPDGQRQFPPRYCEGCHSAPSTIPCVILPISDLAHLLTRRGLPDIVSE